MSAGLKRWQHYERQGYTLKQSHVGWWVDGACGFLVAGYFNSNRRAINTAKREIERVIRKREWPSWRFR